MRVPISTYRVQLHSGFGFVDLQRLAGYLSDLGVTDLYTSPILKACAGSMHGYDITDPSQFNPEIGTNRQFEELSNELRLHGMGLLVDIVPNHMAASVDNPWWNDLLKHGKDSAFAEYFDIDWTRKLLLPVLAKSYGETLDSGDLRIKTEEGRSTLKYAGLEIPVQVPEGANPTRPDEMENVLNAQPYRLAFWRKATDGINYRRFFDVSSLVGLRMDREEVFRDTHHFILELLREGRITGLRIDHIDGLRDPQAYLERLPPVYTVVEKILAAREQLPPDWRTWGTTGYDFLNTVNGPFIDRMGYEALKEIYADFVGSRATIDDVYRSRKRQVMKDLFAGEVRDLTNRLAAFAEEDRYGRDLTYQELSEALIWVTACLPIYRTYIRNCDSLHEGDRYQIEDAIAIANKLKPSPAFAFLRRVLLLEVPDYLAHRRCDWFDFILSWQQFTGPIMAKGLEDTTFYVYNPLLSVNEVGSDASGPEAFFGVEEFHRRMLERRMRWPFTMNATSTHDTKRSEDVRARINVLSELPEEWAKSIKKWTRWNPSDNAPDRNEQVLIYQSLLGAWPIGADRFKTFVLKALREARTHTSWLDPDESYEKRVLAFVDRLLQAEPESEFAEDFSKFQKKIAFHGALSSLSQLALKATAPGVPDFYQGAELWDFSLADPDNRRQVDFDAHIRILQDMKSQVSISDLLKNWSDGRIKMYSSWKALTFRRNYPDLFLRGDYIPLRITGFRSENLVAFARRYHNDWVLVAVPRLTTQITRPGRWPFGGATWLDTVIEFSDAGPAAWTDIFTQELLQPPLIAAKLFAKFPIAILHGSVQ